MKSKTFLPKALMVVLTIILLLRGAVCISQTQDNNTPVIIYQKPTELSENPRSPISNPFFATRGTSYVILGSQFEYGVVAVTLISTAGDFYETQFDTEDGQIIIPITGDAGHYTLTLVTELGVVFEGVFDID